jgi:hypothetical protein
MTGVTGMTKMTGTTEMTEMTGMTEMTKMTEMTGTTKFFDSSTLRQAQGPVVALPIMTFRPLRQAQGPDFSELHLGVPIAPSPPRQVAPSPGFQVIYHS